MPGTPLFPEYLNQGSTGPAVNVLGLVLTVLNFDNRDPEQTLIELDGEYPEGGAIAQAVMQLQEECGIAVDGNFGPATRAAFAEKYGVDLDGLTVEMFTGETVAVSPESTS